jgi:hypothetical protein
MSAVLRFLGLPLNGGSHAHLRRRIDALGIDRSHFTGQATNRGIRSPRRHTAEEVLVLRSPERRRAHPDILRRSLAELGVPMACAECGVGERWNGRPLTLQVDHVDGRFWDCRPTNLRLLCPNCHTQTVNYAGRNRKAVTAELPGQELPQASRSSPSGPVDVAAVLRQVDEGQLGVTAAARLIGCHRNHVYRLRQRMASGPAGYPRQRVGRAAAHRDRVIGFALANPELGPKRIAGELRAAGSNGCVISHGSVWRILRAAGLATISARRAAAGRAEFAAAVQGAPNGAQG